jgi:hypothetical protein
MMILLIGASLAQRKSIAGHVVIPVFPLSGQPGPTYTACIGSSCGYTNFMFPCYTSPQYVATQICQAKLGGTPVYQSSVSNGGQCGLINMSINCTAQKGYNACVGQDPGHCLVSGLYSGPLDYSFPCYTDPPAAASQICVGKGWTSGTATTVSTYGGNQCGYITFKVTCH